MLGPRSMDFAQNLQRHRSTKLLIDRYESMSGGEPVHSQSSFHGAKALSSGLVPGYVSNKKDKSPIRQSLRNLFSVFKKVNITGKAKAEERTLATYRPGHVLPTLASSSVLDFEPLAPPRKLAGPLLYLSRMSQPSASSPTLPVWTTCTASVETGKIVVSWLTTHGNPSIHTIQLSNCTDVRSLSTQQLDAEERALLPREGVTEELRVFEILFEGRAREKFAATSVHERAEWVSAIWDVILPSQEPKERTRGLTKEPFDIPSQSENGITSPPSTAPGYMERSLPPTPVTPYHRDLSVDTRGIPRQTHLTPSSPASPSVYTATRPTSPASITTQPRCNSPSIANLGRLSVVKQRLAQIERESSQSSSASGLTSPMWSPQTSGQSSCATPFIDLKEQDYGPNGLNLQRADSIRSNALDSIVSSYCDVVPVSGKSKRLAPPVREPEDYFPSRVSSDSGSQPAAKIRGSEILHNRSCYPPMDLDDQVLSLQYDVQGIAHPATNREAANRIPYKAKSRVDRRPETDAGGTRSAEARAAAEEKYQRQRNMPSSNDATEILQALQSMRQQLATDFPTVLTALGQIQEGQNTGRDSQASSVFDTNGTFHHNSVLSPAIDLSGLHAKLDELLVSCNGAVTDGPDTEIKQIVPLLQEVQNQAALQAQQQVDSLRYLNELNTWLESFVNNGTSHIHELVVSVDKLSQDLRCGPQRPIEPADGASNVVIDIRQLALGMQARDQHIVALRASVDGLLTKLGGEGPGMTSNVEIIANMIDRQRQDQESLFRSLTSEISDEIKGERLRFVEAMKEATAINVQIHVEHFKEELTREVLGMTQEVGRLHRERQAIQNQIADLFAFYTKQKKSGEASIIPLNTAQMPPQHAVNPHRPLPQARRS